MTTHRYTEAAAEFQKILNHRGLVGLDPIGALAHLQLGRAFALLGDKAKAKSAYQDFLNLWKDADPEIPVLKQANAEYTNLYSIRGFYSSCAGVPRFAVRELTTLWADSRHSEASS